MAETTSTHHAGTWRYVLTINAFPGSDPLTTRVALTDVGEAGPVVAFDWRTGNAETLEPGDGWDVTLPTAGWDYRVLAPVLASGIAVIGDVELFATAGDMRIAAVEPTDTGARVTVLGAGERVELTVWDDGLRTIDVDVPTRGWAVVDV